MVHNKRCLVHQLNSHKGDICIRYPLSALINNNKVLIDDECFRFAFRSLIHGSIQMENRFCDGHRLKVQPICKQHVFRSLVESGTENGSQCRTHVALINLEPIIPLLHYSPTERVNMRWTIQWYVVHFSYIIVSREAIDGFTTITGC